MTNKHERCDRDCEIGCSQLPDFISKKNETSYRCEWQFTDVKRENTFSQWIIDLWNRLPHDSSKSKSLAGFIKA